MPEEAAADKAFRRFAGPETPICIGNAMSVRFTEIGDVGRPDLHGLAVASLGDDREAARIAIRIDAEGQAVTFAADLVFVRVGRAISFHLFADG